MLSRRSLSIAVGASCILASLTSIPAMGQAAQRGARGGGTRANRLPIEGRWNITVTQGDAVYPSWLAVENKDGKLEARFLGRAGSVGGIDKIEFADGTVKFNAHGRQWEGKVTRSHIEGTWKKDENEKGTWVADRSPQRADMAGTWKLKVGGEDVVLTFSRRSRQISGTWKAGDKSMDLENITGFGGRLMFTVDGKRVTAAVAGDSLSGKIGQEEFTGQRKREWGEPVTLFDGKESDLANNWEPIGASDLHWKVIDGVMTNGESADPAKGSHKGTENLVTKRKDFRDFKLHVEFAVPEGGNGGVYLRGRHEVQVQDDYGKEPSGGSCGALYSRIVPKVNACKKAGEWQTYDITLIGSFLTVVQNGQTIIDNQEMEGITGGALDSKEGEPGPIYLQGDHSQVYYRKVILTPAK